MIDENAEAQRGGDSTATPMHRRGGAHTGPRLVCLRQKAPPPRAWLTPSGRLLLSLLVVLLKLLKTGLGSEGRVFSPSPPLWAGCPELGSAEGQQRKWKDKIPTQPLPHWDKPKVCSGCQVLAPHFMEGLPGALVLSSVQSSGVGGAG